MERIKSHKHWPIVAKRGKWLIGNLLMLAFNFVQYEWVRENHT